MDIFNKKKLAALRAENEELRKKINELQLTKDQLSYLDLQKEIDSCNATISNKKNEINNAEFSINELHKKQENLIKDCNELSAKITKDSTKLKKIKPLYLSIKYIIDKYSELDIFNQNIDEIKLKPEDEELLDTLSPTVTLKIHSMDVKELRKELKLNQKAINDVLIKYESRYTTKANLAIYRLMVIALKAELQNVLYNLKFDKLENSISDIKNITTKYLQIADDGNKQILGTITKFITEIEYLFIQTAKIEYVNYTKKQREKEEQAALREQMRQEAEERKELAQQQKQVEKEETKYKNEIAKIQEQIDNSDDDGKLQELQAKILELQAQLNKVAEKKEEIITRQNGKAGYVYVISNLGSFGDDVFKVGMTRRLDPMDRINELGSASVPFNFDVHSFIFSNDAVSLEQKMHNILDRNRVNKVNFRKEFFKINIDDLRKIVEDIDPSAEFNTTMLAEQYKETKRIEEENLIDLSYEENICFNNIMDMLKDKYNVNDICCEKETDSILIYIGSRDKWICRIYIKENQNSEIILHKLWDYDNEFLFQSPEQLNLIQDYILKVADLCNNL